MKKLSVSTVICTKNRTQDLKECIDSIICQTHLSDEIVIVDSSDDDSTRSLIEDYKTKNSIPISYTHTSPGLTKQRNIGIKKSRGSIIAFLDDDVILDRDYFKEIIKCFMISDDISGVQGALTNVNSDPIPIKYLKKIFMYTSYDGKKGVMKRSGFADFQFTENRDHIDATQVLVGCSCCYRKTIFDEYAFDEFFEGYGVMEDVEFSHRVSKHNKLLYTPYAKLVHKKSPADRSSLPRRLEMLIFNHYYVFKKNVKQKSIDWLFFWWSDLGVALQSFFWTLKTKSILPIAGVYSGHRKLLKYMLKG